MSGKSLAVIGMLLLFIVGVLGFFLIKKLLSLFFRPSHVQKIINGTNLIRSATAPETMVQQVAANIP